MKYFVYLAAALVVASPAVARDAGEVGYARGALGYDALVAGDYQRAEIQLQTGHGVSVDDPARLLNLSMVYLRTGRIETARTILEYVRDSRHSEDLELGDGREVNSREVARMMLASINR